MTEKSEPSKSEEERRREAEKLRTEAERSLEAARVKLAHGLIEEITKQRKLSSVGSLRERIKIHIEEALRRGELLVSTERRHLPISSYEVELAHASIKTYESIREDFKEIMEMNDEKLEKLFPKVTTHFVDRMQAAQILVNIISQEKQMDAYSFRVAPSR